MSVSLPLKPQPELILASASSVRQQLLTSVGLAFSVVPSPFDEETAKKNLANLPVPQQAAYLAAQKAAAVSQQHPDKLVLGTDQIGEWEGGVLFKPKTHANALRQLLQLSGRSHQQHTALCVYYREQPIWEYVETAELQMRDVTKQEVEAYLQLDRAYQCCGGYRFEGLGKYLFRSISGSADCILGLPLLPFLNFLQDNGYISLLPSLE